MTPTVPTRVPHYEPRRTATVRTRFAPSDIPSLYTPTERAVVSASADSPDANGYCDFAIGWFRPTRTPLTEIQRCVTKRWIRFGDGYQARWQYLFATGSISEETAESWADSVWPPDADDEDEEK